MLFVAGVLARAEGHWAFEAVSDPEVPEVRDEGGWVRTAVDAFVLEALEREGLAPAEVADGRTLLRRLGYGLTGLMPTVEEVEGFEAEGFDGAVERLLGSVHYGERWGRRWLDVARYSDTKGYAYSPEEFRFVHAWPYRDWVVRAFNADMGYDRFLKLQLAADRMLEAGECDQADLAAMGFLTLGRRFIGVEQDIIDDRIEVVTRGMLGLTVSCARCHDHKFDPVPTTDYYALYGVLKSSREEMVALGEKVEDAGLAAAEKALAERFEKEASEAEGRFVERCGDYLVAALDIAAVPKPEFAEIIGKGDLNPAQVRRWFEYLSQEARRGEAVFGIWKALEKLQEGEGFGERAEGILAGTDGADVSVMERMLREPLTGMEDVARRYGEMLKNGLVEREGLPLRIPRGGHVHDVEWLFDDEGAKVELKKLQAEVERKVLALGEVGAHAVVMRDRPVATNMRVLLRGDYATPGEEVPRRFLGVLGEGRPFHDGSGRLEMAGAIADGVNPLTARVVVNRVWQGLFGVGLVKTASDFGLRSERPSHPELLDYLACRLVESGWSIKSLQRLVVSSAVFRQSAVDDGRGEAIDPENRLLSRYPRRRMDFESMRDALLAVSGELDLKAGGVPGELFGPGATRRRSLYGRIDRKDLPKTLAAFDFANPELHSPVRHETNVPQQALFFMNSPFVGERAVALAARVDAEVGDDVSGRVRRAFELVLQRRPSGDEMRASLAFLRGGAEVGEAAEEEVETAWRYGYGMLDEKEGRVVGFEALPHFTGEAWGGGEQWPDAKLGWVRLTAEGGHVGNDLAHAAVRRWVAPVAGTVGVRGKVRVTDGCGDGVRAVLMSGRGGLLGLWEVAFGEEVEAFVGGIEVEAGEVIDFLVDCRAGGNFSCDEFVWAPVIEGVEVWDAGEQFGGVETGGRGPMSGWEQFCQSLLLSNAFMFVD
ncbi:MAG: DUF1549 and DUF1553 domain-containing protein [Verrucomicrobiales bacterium]|nr:DUF1549 and DUF1553 domain-containing protein [Verrucomicrobiales bacterium]